MERLTDGPVERHLDSLFDRLSGTGTVGRRALAEIEDHLQVAVSEGLKSGLSLHGAERRAIEQFGEPDQVAVGIREANGGIGALARPAFVGAWLVGGLILVAIGFSGLLAELIGRAAGVAFVSGDPPGVTYTAERCADFREYFPSLICHDAATMHHFGEVVEYRVAAGVLGLLALVVLAILRRTTPLGGWRWTPPRGLVPIVLAASFGAATALLGGNGLLAFVGGSRLGIGADLAAGIAAGLACLAALGWAMRVAHREPAGFRPASNVRSG